MEVQNLIHIIPIWDGTSELDSHNPDSLIWKSYVDTFNFLLNPLFVSLFGYSYKIPINKSSFIKWREKNSDWLFGILHTPLYWLVRT